MRKHLLIIICAVVFAACNNETKEPATETTVSPTASSESKPGPVEFADSKYMEIGKKTLAALSSGDMDTWINSFADNAAYRWGSGDSLIGKKAIGDYWRKRRLEVIDSLTYSNDIWLPVKVNEPQQQVQAPGVWLLGWYQVNAKYKTGKRMMQWSHVDMHFDSQDKVDILIQYIDRVPINEAMKK